MNFDWIDNFDDTQTKEIHALMKNEWWCKDRNLADVERILLTSDIALATTNEKGTIVGFARILTDYLYKALIFDVIVASQFRGHGLGKTIINRILKLDSLAEVKSFELYCPDRVCGFYEQLGFSQSKSRLLTQTR